MREAAAQEGQIAASLLAFAERHAAFARRRREGLLLAPELEDLLHRFADDWEELMQVPIGAEILTLVRRYTLAPNRCAIPQATRPFQAH